jgi:hypothetical protein
LGNPILKAPKQLRHAQVVERRKKERGVSITSAVVLVRRKQFEQSLGNRLADRRLIRALPGATIQLCKIQRATGEKDYCVFKKATEITVTTKSLVGTYLMAVNLYQKELIVKRWN